MLDKKGRYQFDSYRGYYQGGGAGVISETRHDGRLDRKELLVGIESDGHAKAYPFEILKQHPLVNDTVGDLDVLVFFERYSDTALVYERTVAGQTLSFTPGTEEKGPEATFVDSETGIAWLALTGEAIAGPLGGRDLTARTIAPVILVRVEALEPGDGDIPGAGRVAGAAEV